MTSKPATKSVVKNGDLNGAIRRWKKKVAMNGTLHECKKREGYDKPGVVRRNKKKEGIKNARKRNKRERRDY